MSVSERLKKLIDESEYTFEQLGELTGIAKSSLQRYASGTTKKIPIDVIELVAPHLNVSAAHIMGWEDDAATPNLPAGAVPYNPTHRIPVLGRISAGLPLLAEEHIEGYIYTELNGNNEYFALRVTGDSMNNRKIDDGDRVIIRVQKEVNNGDIAVVRVNGDDATIKQFFHTDNTVTLVPHSSNPIHDLQIYDCSKTKIEVLGKLVRSITDF